MRQDLLNAIRRLIHDELERLRELGRKRRLAPALIPVRIAKVKPARVPTRPDSDR